MKLKHSRVGMILEWEGSFKLQSFLKDQTPQDNYHVSGVYLSTKVKRGQTTFTNR